MFIPYYTNMPCQCGYPDGMYPRGRMVFPRAPPSGKPLEDQFLIQGKTILPRGDIPSGYPHWHGIFVLLYRTNPNLVRYQRKQQCLPVDPVGMVDVLPVDISPVDMIIMAKLYKPITDNDFHVRYNKLNCFQLIFIPYKMNCSVLWHNLKTHIKTVYYRGNMLYLRTQPVG